MTILDVELDSEGTKELDGALFAKMAMGGAANLQANGSIRKIPTTTRPLPSRSPTPSTGAAKNRMSSSVSRINSVQAASGSPSMSL